MPELGGVFWSFSGLLQSWLRKPPDFYEAPDARLFGICDDKDVAS